MEKIERISQISKIPNVMAAIDGNHIPNKTPQNNHEDYFNRKYFYSYVMQAVVGAKAAKKLCCYMLLSSGAS